uniref:Sodium-bile acid cotransporter n=1 Tax=Solanum tuberosum TaxID=4113 RepID=M1A2Z7_SOLTU
MFESEGSIYLQKKPKVLPIMFIMTADIAGGNATNGDVKCAVAKTTPKEEFCMPTCKTIQKESSTALLHRSQEKSI